MIVGIDPGVSGAIAGVSPSSRFAWVEDMPIATQMTKTRKHNQIDAAGLARVLRPRLAEITLVLIERVHAMPGQGVSGVFSLGDSAGCIRGVCAALGLSVQFVEPMRWKKHAGLVKADKDASRTLAVQLYPGASGALMRKKDHGRAEALLIARFGALVLNAEFFPSTAGAAPTYPLAPTTQGT